MDHQPVGFRMQKPDQGALFVVTGPSGAGKSTLINKVLSKLDFVDYSISTTTRGIRPGEVEGKDYFFLSHDEFKANLMAGRYLEWAEVFGNSYGTPASPIDRALDQGISILLDLDPQGAQQVAERRPNTTFIFIAPPGPEELEQRLRGRGTEDPETLKKRLQEAQACINAVGRFDYIVVNDDLESAEVALTTILTAEIYKTTCRIRQIQKLKSRFGTLEM